MLLRAACCWALLCYASGRRRRLACASSLYGRAAVHQCLLGGRHARGSQVGRCPARPGRTRLVALKSSSSQNACLGTAARGPPALARGACMRIEFAATPMHLPGSVSQRKPCRGAGIRPSGGRAGDRRCPVLHADHRERIERNFKRRFFAPAAVGLETLAEVGECHRPPAGTAVRSRAQDETAVCSGSRCGLWAF